MPGSDDGNEEEEEQQEGEGSGAKVGRGEVSAGIVGMAVVVGVIGGLY